MSHISKIELEIHSLDDLKQACRNMGFEFVDNQTTFKWYASDFQGANQNPDTKCSHVIRVPECEYEIGVVRNGSSYHLVWDNYFQGGLENKIGTNAGRLKQAYAISRVRNEAMRKGYRIRESVKNKNVRIVLSV